MTVFKTILKILNKKKGMLILYTAILISITVLNQTSGSNAVDFEDSKPDVLIVNKDGDMVVEAKYDKVTEFNEFGFASVQKDGKWGAINTQGKEVVEPTYNLKDEIEPSFIGTYYQVKYGFGEVYYTDAK